MENHSEEINLFDYFKVLARRKWLIFSFVFLSVAATAVYSLWMPPVYEARAVIIPAGQQNMLTGIGSIAQQLAGVTSQPSNVAEIVNLLNSDILREKIIRKHGLITVFFGDNPLPGKTDDEKLWAGLRFMKGAVRVNYKARDNAIEITAQFRDPKTATEIIDHILNELTEHMVSETKRVALTNKRSLESVLYATADPLLRNKIYNLIAQQIEVSMMAEVKENFAFKVLDPPRVPDLRVKPQRRQMVMIAFAVSLLAGVFSAFLLEYYHRVKKGARAGSS